MLYFQNKFSEYKVYVELLVGSLNTVPVHNAMSLLAAIGMDEHLLLERVRRVRKPDQLENVMETIISCQLLQGR